MYFFIERNVKINKKEENVEAPLFVATQEDHDDACILLYKKNMNSTENNATVLLKGAIKVNILQYLKTTQM